jgi:hypothetical protein
VENRFGIQKAAPSRVVEASVRHSAALLFLAVACFGREALAQNPREVFNHLANDPQLVLTKPAEAELRTSSDAETTCVERNLRRQGSSISALMEHGISTSDERVAPERTSCQKHKAQLTLRTGFASPQTDPYSIDGLALGSRVAFGTPAYRLHHCLPSQKFRGFFWCTKTIKDQDARGGFKVYFSILHAPDGTVVYVNRYQDPAYWYGNEVGNDIQRYSRKIGEEPHIIQLPSRLGLPKGILATWGKVVLEPVVGDELKLLREDKSIQKGIAIDFIGNFTQSARQGLPIYRLAGGAGFVWAASYNESGRGTLRFSAVDASAYSPQSSLIPAATPVSVAPAPPGGSAMEVDAQSMSPRATVAFPVDGTALPLHRGEQLSCSAAPDCGAPAPALASVVTPPRDAIDVTTQVPSYTKVQLQHTDPSDGAGKYAREPSVSSFRSTEPLHGMLDLISAYWAWVLCALTACGPAGYWSTRPQVARGRGGVPGWQGWAALAFAIGLVVAILLPGQAGLYLDALLLLLFLCVTGYVIGARLRGAHTCAQIAAARLGENACPTKEVTSTEATSGAEIRPAEDPDRAADTPRAVEDKVGEDARPAAELRSFDEARRAADVIAVEEAPRVAEVKAADETRRTAEPEVSEEAQRAAEMKAEEDTPQAAEANATVDAHGAVEANPVENTRRAAERSLQRKSRAPQKSSPPRTHEASQKSKSLRTRTGRRRKVAREAPAPQKSSPPRTHETPP